MADLVQNILDYLRARKEMMELYPVGTLREGREGGREGGRERWTDGETDTVCAKNATNVPQRHLKTRRHVCHFSPTVCAAL